MTFWSIWNEPDYTAQLKPQSIGNAIPNSPHMYRGLVDAAWNGLKATGHGHDKVLIGELAPRGYPHIQYGGLYPVTFVQSLYCLDSHYRPLRGSIAKAEGCPTNAAGTRSFRSANPGLFKAYGFSDHPYMRWYPPDSEQYYTCKTGLCTSLADYGNLTSALDQSLRADGSNKKYSIFSTEFGYQTSPPKPYYNKKDKAFEVPVATAAMYLNWAEYLSYKNPRIGSYDQYLLADPASTAADNFDPYASGIEFANGRRSPGTTPSHCRCTCRRRMARTAKASRCGAASGPRRSLRWTPAAPTRRSRSSSRQGVEHVHDGLDGDDHEPRGVLRHPCRVPGAAARSGCSTRTRRLTCCSRRASRSTAAT